MLDRIDRLEAQMREVMTRLPPKPVPLPVAPERVPKDEQIPSPSPFAAKTKPGPAISSPFARKT